MTSNAGWDTIIQSAFLSEVVAKIKSWGVRVSIFVEPDLKMVEGALACGCDRIELYTEQYASGFPKNKEEAVKPFVAAAQTADNLGIGLNAGHDLDLQNLAYLKEQIPSLLEVSIGHALIADALYFGLENTIQMYLRQLKP